MQLKVVQKQNGELLFVECNADFVNLLMQVQEMPIGILSKLGNTGNAVACLRDSLPNLQNNHLFAVASVSNNSMDLESLLKQPMIPETPVTEPISSPIPQTWNMNCQGSNNGPYRCTATGKGGWDKAVAFRNVGTSFEIAIKLPGYPAIPYDVMLGILPDDANLRDRLSTPGVFRSYGCFLEPTQSAILYPSDRKEKIPNLFNFSKPVAGKELRMRYYHESQRLEYSYDGSNKWHKVNNVRGYSIEEGTVCCPVLLACDTDPITVVTEVKSIQPLNPVTDVTGVKSIQPTEKTTSGETSIAPMMFLVTNELKVMNNIGLCSHLDWLKQQNISLSTLKTSSVTFGSVELKKLICAVMNGKRHVLEAALEEHLTTSNNVAGTNNEDRSKSAHPIPVVQVGNDNTSSSSAEDWTASGDY